MKTKLDPTPKSSAPIFEANLILMSNPANLLDIVRRGSACIIPTKPLNVFYVMADSIEKAIKDLKEKCRPVIIGRRNEGEPAGDKGQHRQFCYTTPQGEVTLTVQERITQRPDPEKLETLLKEKSLWEIAQTTSLDLEKVEGLRLAGMLTAEELASVSTPHTGYALIAHLESRKP